MKKIVVIAALMLSACGKPPGMMNAQEKIDESIVVCKNHTQFLYIPISGYAASFTPNLVDGKTQTC